MFKLITKHIIKHTDINVLCTCAKQIDNIQMISEMSHDFQFRHESLNIGAISARFYCYLSFFISTKNPICFSFVNYSKFTNTNYRTYQTERQNNDITLSITFFSLYLKRETLILINDCTGAPYIVNPGLSRTTYLKWFFLWGIPIWDHMVIYLSDHLAVYLFSIWIPFCEYYTIIPVLFLHF